MTITVLARNGYDASTKSTGTPRGVEYQLLARLTGALAIGEKNKNTDYTSYVIALSKNLEFWTVIGADVASDGNGLSGQLRAQIFNLYEFTREHTRKIIGGDKNLTVEPLIDINKNIMSGLRGDTGASEETP